MQYKGLLITALLFVLVNCKKNQNQDNAPIVPVDIYVNLNLPQNQPLAIPGGWAYAQGGIKGVIIYRRGMDEFVAFDRNCTYNEENSCGTATVDSSNVLIDCSCDGSVYNIFDGSVNQGPATLPLRQYNASYDGGSTVHVFN
jgi:Rieske Fe-S protein